MAENRSVAKRASIRGLLRRTRRQTSKFELSSSEPSEASSVSDSSSTDREPSPESIPEQQQILAPTIKFNLSTPREELPIARECHQWPLELREKRPGSYMFDTLPMLVQTPWERQRQRNSTHQRPRSVHPSPVDRLSRSIMNRIVESLKESYCSDDNLSVHELRNDLCALSRASKRWYRVAHVHLYDEVWLPSNERPRGRRLSLVRHASALAYFKRTLGESAPLADTVRHLRIPYGLSREIQDQSSAPSLRHSDDTLQLIADIVTLCPNLELFTGFWGPDCDGHLAIWDALATRPMLKSHCWAMDPSWDLNTRIMPGYHAKWQRLETLAISDTQLGTGTLFGILWFLPSLKHLLLRNISGTGIHKGTLMMLPALESLRLEGLAGITDDGLDKMVSPKIARSLKRLTLVDMNVQAMETIQTLMACFTQLKRFALIQDASPELDGGSNRRDSGHDFLLYSASLQELSWGTKMPEAAIAVIASSIAAGQFPSLRKVKTPGDDKVVIQRLSHPNAQSSAPTSPCLGAEIDTFESQTEMRTMAEVVGSYLDDTSSKIEFSKDSIHSSPISMVSDFGSAIIPMMRGVYDQMLDFHSLF